MLLDFTLRRRYQIDVKAGTFSEWSLYSHAAFKAYEIGNREYLARSLEVVRPGTTQREITLAEHELAIAHPRSPGKPELRNSERHSEFWVGDLSIMRFTRQGTPLSADDAKLLAHYFRYSKGGHPVALAALQAQGNLPSEVVMVSSPFQAMRTTVRFSVIPLEQAPRASLEGLRKVAAAGLKTLPDDLAQAAFRIADESDATIADRAQAIHQQAEASFALGNVLAGFLTGIEYNLQKGGMANDLLARHRATIMSARWAPGLLASLDNAGTKEAAERSIASLQAARAEAGDKAYVLGIFEANHQKALRRPQEARALFVAALRANPYIASVWKDLGDSAYSELHPAEAWLCWDTGRRIAPQFENFRSVKDFEQRLARDLPDYF